jgi:hypothetical protein
MAGYIGSKASVVSSGVERKKTYSITGSTTSLTGLNYTVGKVHVYQNGVRLLDGTDYTATNGTSITLTVAAQSGDNVVVVSQASFQLSEHYTSAEADAEFVTKTGDTMSGNLNVTGTVTSDGLQIGDNQYIYAGNGADLKLGHDGTDSIVRSQGAPLYIDANGTTFRGYSPYTKHMNIASNGDISFYEDTGTTAKFFWDASAEALGIGVVPQSFSPLMVNTATDRNIAVFDNATGATIGGLTNECASAGLRLAGSPLIMTGNGGSGAEHMRIDSSGRLLLGTTTSFADANSDDLQIAGSGDTGMMIKSGTSSYGSIYFGDATSGGARNAGIVRYKHGDDNMQFWTAEGERVRIDSNGNVGIGTGSSTLSAKLVVSGPNTILHDNGGATLRFNKTLGTDTAFIANRSYNFHDGNGLAIATQDSNPIRFATNNTERMRIDASGAVTMPYQPAFMATKVSGEQANITPSTTTTVSFPSEVFDNNADYNNGTATFTAPVTGKYHFNINIRTHQIDTSPAYYHIHLRTSNRTYGLDLKSMKFASDPTYWTFNSSVLVDMDAGDTAYVTFYQHGGSTQVDLQGSVDSQFCGFLVA